MNKPDYSSYFHFHPLPSWVYDLETFQILDVNLVATSHYGYSREEFLSFTLDDFQPMQESLQSPADQDNQDQAQIIFLGVFTHQKKSGEQIRMKINGHNTSFGEKSCRMIIAQDVTDDERQDELLKESEKKFKTAQRYVTSQKTKELELELLAQISMNFNLENDFSQATNSICQTISEFGKFDLVELWATNYEKTHMNLLTHHVRDPEDKKFYTDHGEISAFLITAGLPGNVYSSQTQLLWSDVNENEDFVRRESAKKIGLKSMIGIPLIFNKVVVGVLLIGSKQETQSLTQYARIFQTLENFIGSELNRKRLENDLIHLFDAIPGIIYLGDFKGHFLKMNRAGCALLGYGEQEILNLKLDEIVHPDDRESTIGYLNRLEKGELSISFENRCITKSGEIRWLSWFCNSSLDEGLVYATAKNITEEKRLRELNRQASTLAKIGSWELDYVGGNIYWSETVHELHETDPASFVPNLESGINFYREDFRPLVQAEVQNCISKGLPFDFEVILVTAKNNERWVRAIGRAEMIDGQCKRMFGSFQDIHDRKDAESRLQSLADNLPGVVFQYLIYPDGKDALKYVSKGSELLWGFSSKDVIGDNNLVWDQIILGGEIQKVQKSIFDSVQLKKKWSARWNYVMPNGESRTHVGYGSPDFLTDGTVIFNSVILDASQEAKNEELLEQVAEMASIGSWELDLINQKEDSMYWSPMTKEILECEDHYNPTLTGGFEFYTEGSKTLIQNEVGELIQEGKEFDTELLVITAKGNEKWIRCIGKCKRTGSQCTKIYGSFQDIDASKRLELKIGEILGSISDAFYALDENWNFTYFNREAERSVLHNKAALLGKSFWGEFPGTLGTPLEEVYRQVATTGESHSFEYLFPGDEKWYEINVYPSNGGVTSYLKNIDERRQAVEELQKANDEKHAILESIGDAFFTMKNDFEVTYWNKAAELLIGVKREEIIGKNLWKVFPDAVHLPSYTNYHLVLETKETLTFEDYYGTWLEVNAYPSIDGISVFFKDISSRKEAAEQLKKAFEEKSIILESIGDAFFAVDKHWTVTYWNKEAEIILGRKREDVVGKSLWEAYADVVNTEFYRQYFYAMTTGNLVNFEEYYPSLNKWFEVSAYPSKDGLSVYFKDVSLRKEADIRLLEANERFEKVTEATNDAIWDWDITNQTFYRSHGINRFFGEQAPKSLSQKDFWKERFHPDDLEEIQESIQKAVEDPRCDHWEKEYRLFNEDNELLYVIDRGVIIRNKKGKAIRMVGAMTNISERKNLELQMSELNISLSNYAKELERSNEELEQFAFITSHDLQEPLRMISSFMDLLKRKYGHQLDDKAHQYINFAVNGSKRMKHIILDLLEYSRAGNPSDNIEKVDMNELLIEFKGLRRSVISEKSALIISENLPILETYRAAITQILHSLLDNAIKYSKENTIPKIEIKASETKMDWQFSVKDNGIGIDSQFYDKIFGIFQRLHNRDKYAGTGIGLSIAKRHVELLGGKIWLNSESGVGTEFYFTLPKTIKPTII